MYRTDPNLLCNSNKGVAMKRTLCVIAVAVVTLGAACSGGGKSSTVKFAAVADQPTTTASLATAVPGPSPAGRLAGEPSGAAAPAIVVSTTTTTAQPKAPVRAASVAAPATTAAAAPAAPVQQAAPLTPTTQAPSLPVSTTVSVPPPASTPALGIGGYQMPAPTGSVTPGKILNDCSYVAPFLVEAVDMNALTTAMTAQGYTMPSPTWRNPQGVAVANALEENLKDAQAQINAAAGNCSGGAPIAPVLTTVPGSASSLAFAQLVKAQLDGDGLKNYTPAVIQ